MDKKQFSKFSNEEGLGAVQVIILVTAYLFVVSLVIGFFVTSIYGLDVVNPVELPHSEGISIYSSEQNYTGECNMDWVIHTTYYFSTWRCINGVGLMLDSYNGVLSIADYPKVGISDIQSSNGVYTNYYTINNSVKGDYYIIIGYYTGYQNNVIQVTNNGFGLKGYIFPFDKAFEYPDANQYEHAEIKTVYDQNANTVEFYFNGDYLFTWTDLHSDTAGYNYYAGVGSQTVGFALEDFKTDNQIIKDNTGGNFLSAILTVITVLFKGSTWSLPDWIIPVGLQAFLFTLPESLLVISLVIVARGVD